MTDIVICGEAWGEYEERTRTPFVGAAGRLLNQLLGEADIARTECFLTNVFNLRPTNNRIESLCGPKTNAIEGYPSLSKGFVRREYAGELDRLGNEILEHNPNLIIAMGATPTWALLGKTGIGAMRGFTYISSHTVSGYKVLPTYHPSGLFRDWSNKPIVVLDLIKAKRESTFPEIRRPARRIFIPETVEDIREFEDAYLRQAARLSVDIETSGNQVTILGISPDSGTAIVIPFVDSRRPGRAYWPTKEHEVAVWTHIRDIMQCPIPKTFQNGLFDITFLYRAYGIKVINAEHDTMLLHHALQPEALKGLGFLGSIYTDERNWKRMRQASLKRDE